MTLPLSQSAGRPWLVVGSALTIVGGALFPVALLDYTNARVPAGWSRTTGVVEHSGVSAATVASGRLGSSLSYSPDVRYRYAVAGQQLSGTRVYRDTGTVTGMSAQQTAGKYPVGSTVAVYFDPASPDQAVLDPAVQATTWQALAATGLALLIGIAGLLRFRVLRRAELGIGAAALLNPHANRKTRRRNRRA